MVSQRCGVTHFLENVDVSYLGVVVLLVHELCMVFTFGRNEFEPQCLCHAQTSRPRLPSYGPCPHHCRGPPIPAGAADCDRRWSDRGCGGVAASAAGATACVRHGHASSADNGRGCVGAPARAAASAAAAAWNLASAAAPGGSPRQVIFAIKFVSG